MPKIQVGPSISTLDHGDTFLVSNLDGTVDEARQLGFFSEDTRFLSEYGITINRKPWELVTSANLNYFRSRLVMANPRVRTSRGPIGRHRLSMTIERALGIGLHEDIDIVNYGLRSSAFFIEVTIASDFADMWDVRARKLLRRGNIETRWDEKAYELTSLYERDDFRRGFSYRIERADSEPRFANGDIVFEVSLEPGESWHVCAVWSTIFDDQKREPIYNCGGKVKDSTVARSQERWRKSVTVLECADEDVSLAYNTSVEDLGSLRMCADPDREDTCVPAAGIPWFAALFGRDSLITCLETMMLAPGFSRGTLAALASRQAKDLDDFRDAEPGKILHELRVGELAHFNEIPQTPYYGTVDATSLYPILLHEAFHWLGDDQLLKEHLDCARKAMEWIDRYGDLDEDGFLEYRSRSSKGLRNQGWKDSALAVIDEAGRQVDPPIAPCEAQGYAYDARMRMAEIEERVGDPQQGKVLRNKAQELSDRFNEAFWIEDEGTYAFALGPDKQMVRSIVSNAGHCLWSGIVPQDRAKRVAGRLLADDMWSGWGIRTLSSQNPAYNPSSYQLGSVWPHDNALIAAGMRRYGLREEANIVAKGIFDAAASFQSYRLPELFAGFTRTDPGFPIPYRRSNVPQAWSSASLFFLLRTILGIDVREGKKLFVDPVLPHWLQSLRLGNLTVGNSKVSLRFEGETFTSEGSGGIEVIAGRPSGIGEAMRLHNRDG